MYGINRGLLSICLLYVGVKPVSQSNLFLCPLRASCHHPFPTGSFVQIPLCGFHCANSIVWILLCKFHRVYSIVRISSCGFRRTCANATVHIPLHAFRYVHFWRIVLTFVFALPLVSTGMHQQRSY